MEGNYEREQIEYLMNIPLCEEGREYLTGMGYFDAPASGHHHLAERGGLVKHSVHVTRWLLKLTESMGVCWPRHASPYIVGMFHDIIKARCYEFKTEGDKEVIVRAAHPYAGHGSASAIIVCAELGLQLYPAEASAIVHHMGAFHLEGNELKDYDRALQIYPKEIIAVHTADMLAARWDEEWVPKGALNA